MMWVVGAFVLCPCHLPLTLAALTAILAGTAAGALVAAHPFTTGFATTAVWFAGTWHGMRLMRRAEELETEKHAGRRI